jgi:CHAT domain-containing protein
MEHASWCPNCGPLLRDAIAVFSPDEPLLEPSRFRWFLWPRIPAGAFLSIAGVAAAAIAWFAFFTPSRRVPVLLAEAYTENRPFDFRLPNRGYSPARTQRGLGDSPLSKSPSLLEAEAILARRANDPEWWKWKGLAELLERSPNEAVQTLSRAQSESPKDAALALELAVAHAVRAETDNRPEDYAAALDILSAQARQHPNDPAILFNRALVCERLVLTEEAIRQWRRYLELDHKSPWAAEAHKHLDALEHLHSERDRLRQQFADGQLVGDDSDEYMERAVVEWFTRKPLPAETIARLAGFFKDKAGDKWVEDAAREAGQSADAADLLNIVDRNLKGEADQALALAAKWLERGEATPALAARARYERVYALQRAVTPPQCIAESLALEPDLTRHSYRWLQIQNQLSRAVCMAAAGREGEAIQALETVEHLADEAHMLGVHLRATGLLGNERTLAGDPWAAWESAVAGLNSFWNSAASPRRGHQFYFNLMWAAQRLNLRFVALDFGHAMIDQVALTGNPATEALDYSLVAEVAMAAGLPAEAADQFDRAAALQSAIAISPTTRRYQWEAKFARVQATLDSGQTAEAERLIRGLEVQGDTPDVASIVFSKELLMGRIASSMGDSSSADTHLAAALHLANSRVASQRNLPADERMLDDARTAVMTLMEHSILERHDPSAALQMWFRFTTGAKDTESLRSSGSEAWLVYLVIHERIAAWLMDQRGVEFHWINETPSEIQRLNHRFLDSLSAPTADLHSTAESAGLLHSQLIAPFSQKLSADPMLMIMTGPELAALPFDLLAPPGQPELAATHQIIRADRFRPAPAVPAISGTQAALIVAEGDPFRVAGKILPPLPEALAEAHDIATTVPGGNLLEGAAATVDTIESLGSRACLFHFAGHAFAGPSGGALVLADSVLDSKRIMHMNWTRCRLAVLSGCLTSNEGAENLAGPNSLVNAFLTAGADSVIASRWKVDSSAARQWMRSFYAALAMGATTPVALNAARRALRSDPAFRHPYYWAAFQVYE